MASCVGTASFGLPLAQPIWPLPTFLPLTLHIVVAACALAAARTPSCCCVLTTATHRAQVLQGLETCRLFKVAVGKTLIRNCCQGLR